MAPSAMPVHGDSPSPPYTEQINSGRQGITADSLASESSKIPEMPVAIVGMSCRLPGEVSTPDEFWELCSRARSGWSPMPKSRFNHSTFHHPNPDKPGCYNPEGGHFLVEDIGLFDAPFFNVTEKEAVSMDPQQRLLLECTYEALENAGIPKRDLVGQNVGVFVGGSFADYELRNCRDTDTAPCFQATGCAQSLLSNRLSYYFDLYGPSLTVDTACSSSLGALHLACQSLRNGESSQAIVASAHLNVLPDYFIVMSMSSLFSNEGKSFAFDHRGNGFGRGEGVGCIVLKPLDQALRDNDSIRAIIAGSGMNQDGRTKGITMPNGDAQVRLMKSIYAKYRLDPKDTGYVEAHGTGTKAGDPIEATALHEVFGGRTKKQPLFIGSVKSNIGHLEGASGVVSVIKTAMMLEKGFVLPNCNFEKGNPKIPFDEWGLKVPISQRPWPRGKKYASINNFGFGGTNAHAVLERSPAAPRQLLPGTNDTFATGNKASTKRLYVLSANDKPSLEGRMHDLTVYLEQRPEVFQNSLLPNLAYTLGQRRSHLAHKVAIPARGSAELIPALASNDIPSSRSIAEPKIGFVFTGQGAQWHAMGRELLDAYPVFAATMERIDRYLTELGADFSLLDELSKGAESSKVSTAHISQPACTAIQLALTDLLKSWGIRPSAVTGHSSGEIGAAYAAGALSLESCVTIAYFRGQMIVLIKKNYAELKGAMMAVGGSPGDVCALIKSLKKGKATVACINSPSSITASGDEEAINELQAAVEEKQMFNRRLHIDTAYHSHHMELVADDYREAIKDVKSQRADSVFFHSSLKGCQIRTADLGPSYWVENLICPVRFSEALQSMCASTDGSSIPSVDILLEIGPHAALEGPIKQILKSMGGNHTKIPYSAVLLRNKDSVDTALQLAATMFMKGVEINFEAINFPFPGIKVPVLLTNLPRYSWNHSTKYWHESRIAERHSKRPFARNDLIGTLASYSNDLEPTWRNIIRADDMPWVRHHKMQNMSVYPMAGYIAMAVEAASQRAVLRNVTFDKFELREVTVSRPLVIHEGTDLEANITLRAFAEGTRTSSDAWDEFRIFSWAKDRSWIEHCRGLISAVKSAGGNFVDGAQQKLDTKMALVSKINAFTDACTSEVNTLEMYETLSAAGAGYGQTFQGLENCRAGDNHAVADLIVPDTAAVMPKGHEPDFIIHPAFLDQFIQIVWPIFGAGWKGLDVLYMPSFVKSMSLSTSITRKSGDRMRVFATGNPTPAHPVATKLSLFATSSDTGDEALISMESLVMTPVFDGSDVSSSTANRELCFKLQWEPLPAKYTNACGADTPVSFTSDAEVTNGVDVTRISDLDVSLNGGMYGMLTPPTFDTDVAIICDEATQPDLLCSLQDLIFDLTQRSPTVYSFGSVETEGKVCIVLSELAKPIISNLSSADFQYIQKMLAGAVGVLWVVRGAYTNSSNPDAEMVIGMARSVRSETLLKFVTLDLGASPELSSTGAANKIFEVLKLTFSSDSPAVGADMEFQERNGALFIPRVVHDVEMDKFVHQETQCPAAPSLQPFNQSGRPLKIAIETPGALDTIYFTDDLAVGTPLPDFEVEIQVMATSMNFKDIMISMGQLSSGYLGVECAGIITAVGSKVTDLNVGDRVCAMSQGAYATYSRCLETSAHKISPSMSFEDASTIPVIYCTAFYSLFDLGRLIKGESVLIHAAAGGVGQAAIILCQMTGAEIFATVSSIAKKEFLMSEYHIPEDHIFYSRNTSFAKAIHRATNGRGVDVVLNSLAGDALRETWDCLAHFGRFIEIGKLDIISNSRLEMARFEHNAIFASVDLTVVAAERPKIMKRLLSDVFGLIGKGLTPKNLLQADASYVIIGGTGGLGRSISRWMIEKGARNIVLLSRSGKTDGKVGDLIDEAKTVGANIIVKACDVTSKDHVEKLVSTDLSHLPSIKGVIHAAMVLDDVLFEKMTHSQWISVVSAKVSGAWNFHNALLTTPLSFFILLSSAAGAVGNRGQAAYAAANCFLNAFAQHRHTLGLPASSIDLAPVSDAGYLAEGSAERAAQIAENLGSEMISEKEVLALVAAAVTGKIGNTCGGHCITGLKITSEAKDSLFWVEDAKFRHLKDTAEAEASELSASSPITAVSLGAALEVAESRQQAIELICEGLMTKVSAVLMVPREDMDPSKAIVVYGLDSLVAIEIRNWITRELEASLQVLELLTSGSFWSLSEAVLAKSRLRTMFVGQNAEKE
ncbi:beta-ketoacyl synthase domain-containing protein-2 [Diplocarpon rosae]|nr:beta-ketoacyl synthase domain-containing protein-2 [Diplocarpon rosae]